MKYTHFMAACIIAGSPIAIHAQKVMNAGGKGTYAAYTPLSEAQGTLTQPLNQWGIRSGDQTQVMRTRRLYMNEKPGQPIPTNDWWTDMLFENFGGNLWTYPMMVRADNQGRGLQVNWPSYWIDNGTEVKSRTQLLISADDFKAKEAIVESWSDWTMSFSLESDGKQMLVTTAQGMPYTWIETSGELTPQFSLPNNAQLLTASGSPLQSGTKASELIVSVPWNADGQQGTDLYVLFLPQGTLVSQDKSFVSLTMPDADGYISVALLPTLSDIETLRPTAYAIPRDTRVDWKYDETSARLTTTWTVTAEDLRTHQPAAEVMQGFIPHQYRGGAQNDAQFSDLQYLSPHGQVRMARGNGFNISYTFNGMLPYYAMPTDTTGTGSTFKPERMKQLIADYAQKGSFGGDTYWGGKGLTQMGLYMMFAREMGETELFNQCRSRLKAAFENWLQYTPGEEQYFFAYTDRYGGMIGSDTSYGSDEFNDHHFHYGYFTYAAALLCMVDDDFRTHYGPILKLIAKDYANWDRSDLRFPLFRTFNPWGGHSFAGGKGDGNGNGQESSSEAMQSWGGLYLLGEALGDKEMRDAGIFGWVTEARGTAEYWFDRYRPDTSVPFDRTDTSNFNIDYSKFSDDRGVHPYNSNYTCHGVGWWNYFSGDQLWNAAIQWMPISPALDYLSEDLEFTKWDYNTAWNIKMIGGWFDRSSHTEIDNQTGQTKTIDDGSLGDGSGLGNVVLSYLQRFDPEQAAEVYDKLWDANASTAKATDTGGITYFVTHSHLSHGELDWTVTPSIPTARAYRNADGTYTFMAYNVSTSSRDVKFYKEGELLYTLTAKPQQLTVSGMESQAVSDITAVDYSEADPREELEMENLALGKTCTESSHENVGCVPEHATDGDDGSRWGSQHTDNEWLMVDLGEVADIYKVRIKWEAAYAAEYKIMLSTDGDTWYEQMEAGQANQWVTTLMGDRPARYVKMQGVSRGTAYGYSLYEIQVYGQKHSLQADDMLGIRLSAQDDYLTQYKPGQILAKGYTVGKQWVDVEPQWKSADGDITADGIFTPATFGTATVQATVGKLTATKALPVEEALHVDKVSLTPGETQVLVSDPYTFTLTTTDQFDAPTEHRDPQGVASFSAWESTGDDGKTLVATSNAGVNDHGVFTATQPGTYAVVAEVPAPTGDAVVADTAYVTAVTLADMNLALGRPATATSQEGDGNSADKAFDGIGEGGTRWSSAWQDMTKEEKDNQSLTVTLNAEYVINRVVIYWEAARAKEWKLQVSTDGVEYTDVVTVTDVKTGRNETTFAPVNARYVRMQGISREMDYGYSIYEMEVYGIEKVSTGINAAPDATLPADSKAYDLSGRPASGKSGIIITQGRKYAK